MGFWWTLLLLVANFRISEYDRAFYLCVRVCDGVELNLASQFLCCQHSRSGYGCARPSNRSLICLHKENYTLKINCCTEFRYICNEYTHKHFYPPRYKTAEMWAPVDHFSCSRDEDRRGYSGVMLGMLALAGPDLKVFSCSSCMSRLMTHHL